VEELGALGCRIITCARSMKDLDERCAEWRSKWVLTSVPAHADGCSCVALTSRRSMAGATQWREWLWMSVIQRPGLT
jgi:hypothetical protein